MKPNLQIAGSSLDYFPSYWEILQSRRRDAAQYRGAAAADAHVGASSGYVQAGLRRLEQNF
jgi:hypothetical protein